MTILTALEAVADSLSRKVTFIYADLNEANLDMDKIVKSDFPVLIVVPFVPVDAPGKSGILKTTFELNAFMLNKASNITVDFKASVIETEVIAPMRLLARRYMHLLNEHSIIDPETAGITSINYQPMYSSMDADLFGVMIRATVPVIENETICVP